MKPAIKKRVREAHETSDVSTESAQHRTREHGLDLAAPSCSAQDIVASVSHVEDYTHLDEVSEKLQSAATRVQDAANKRYAASIAEHANADSLHTLYRRSLRMTKAHEHDVDTTTEEYIGRTIRDITATFVLGLTSMCAQKLSFRLVNDFKDDGTSTIDSYLDWLTTDWRAAMPTTAGGAPAAAAAEPEADEGAASGTAARAAGGAAGAGAPAGPAELDAGAAPSPAAPAAAVAAGTPPVLQTPLSSRHRSPTPGVPPASLFMLEMEAEESPTSLSRSYNTVEWHRAAFEALRQAAGLAEVDRQPVEHFVKDLGLLVLELVGCELGQVDERGVGLGVGAADLEHLVKPLYA